MHTPHLTVCRICGREFDKRDLTQVTYHATDPHQPVPTIEAVGVMLRMPEGTDPAVEIDVFRQQTKELVHELSRAKIELAEANAAIRAFMRGADAVSKKFDLVQPFLSIIVKHVEAIARATKENPDVPARDA